MDLSYNRMAPLLDIFTPILGAVCDFFSGTKAKVMHCAL